MTGSRERIGPERVAMLRRYAKAGLGLAPLPTADEAQDAFNRVECLHGGPDRWDWDGVTDEHETKRVFRRLFGFAIPCREAIGLLASLGPLVDCGAGTGYWARLLANAGADVVAFDQPEPAHGLRKGRWHPVRLCGLVGRVWARERAVLLVWPPYDDPFAFQVAEAVRPGARLVYVGEGNGGCTGDDDFHALLADSFDEEREMAIPYWWGLHDRLWIYRRRGA